MHNIYEGKELKKKLSASAEKRTTVSFYKYAHIPNPAEFRDKLFIEWSNLGVLGRVNLAKEGINAQVSILAENVEAFKRQLDSISFLKNVRLNYAVEDDGKSFFKLKIKVRDR